MWAAFWRWLTRWFKKGPVYMAVTVVLAVDKPHPVSGDTVTATYTITGLSPVTGKLIGSVTVNGVSYPAAVQMGDAVTFDPPTIPGLTFTSTANPNVFTAKVP